MEFERINPLTNETARKALAMTDAAAVADRAAEAFAQWAGPAPTPDGRS